MVFKEVIMTKTSLSGWNFCHELLNESHVIIGGATGSGKSVLLDDILYTLAGYDPNDDRIVLLDIKRVGLKKWRKLPHVIRFETEFDTIRSALSWVNAEMDRRYVDMYRKDLELSDKYRIYVIIDEANEVLTDKACLEYVNRLMRLARAAEIHLIMATQDVSRTTGIPARIWKNASCTVGLRCNNPTDSRQIIGIGGCEKLPRFGQSYIRDSAGVHPQMIPLTTREKIDNRIHAYL